jgi:Eco57I restriction-modification methylase/N-6 DNA Methylase
MARRAVNPIAFEAIAIEGALIAPGMLGRIGALAAGEQTEADYRLDPGIRIRDEIGFAFASAETPWARFQRSREAGGGARAITRFATDLLHQVFGFDSLEPIEPPVVEGRVFPIRLAALGGRVPVVVAPPRAEGAKRSGLDESLPQFAEATRRRSATLLLQEYLNATKAGLWGIALDGLTLRILRNNVSLTRPAWIEADLERILGDRLFADFSVLWLLLHETRFGGPNAAPVDCPIERWRETARAEGVKARERLRGGFEKALAALGDGFLKHPANTALREALTTGALDDRGYFQELLRLVYRFIFLFTAEDRDQLHPPEAKEPAKRLYAEGYSLSRLRDHAVRRAAYDGHHDLYEGIKLVSARLAVGEPKLGLPALGGLFLPDTTPDLDRAILGNRSLLTAIFDLAWLADRESGGIERINWRDMETEELGSVYEGLLELTPGLETGATGFSFAKGDESKDNVRKRSGSYYTPDVLVQLLLDAALDPVIDAAVKANSGREVSALLDLDIIDPACGSGHFLLAAGRRIAQRIVQIENPGAPSDENYRHALREVARHCLYGVDRNPLAVELCKVALWIETVEPGKPLSFLDGRIREGDSLVGVFDLATLADGIPDEAYKALASDDKAAARYYAARNSKERKDRPSLPLAGSLTPLSRAARSVEGMPEDEVAEIERKAAAFCALATHPDSWRIEIACDLFIAAFFAPKTGPVPNNPNTVTIPTTDHLWRKLNNEQLYGPLEAAAIDVARDVHAFHWPLAFPEVFAKGGFDCVLGNPPWVRQELLTPIKRQLSTFAAFASTADSSVYFLERSVQITRPRGRIALLTPNKWLRAAYGENLREVLRKRCRLHLLVDFGHSRNLFPDADTFPAAVNLEPAGSPVPNSETFRFVKAHDADRERHPLPQLIRQHAISINHGYLRRDGWRLEGSAASDFFIRLMATGQPLEAVLRGPMLSGLKTGLNRAFYIQSSLRDAMLRADPNSEPLFKRFLRGRDVKRWVPVWEDQWHIVIPSS